MLKHALSPSEEAAEEEEEGRRPDGETTSARDLRLLPPTPRPGDPARNGGGGGPFPERRPVGPQARGLLFPRLVAVGRPGAETSRGRGGAARAGRRRPGR